MKRAAFLWTLLPIAVLSATAGESARPLPGDAVAAPAAPAPASEDTTPAGAEGARRLVLDAFRSGRPSLLVPLLPPRAKVNLSLREIAPARGLHDGGQVQVLLERFFERCPPLGFRLDAEGLEGGAVRIEGTLSARCAAGTKVVGLQVVLEPVGGGWRLGEVWETE